MGKHTINFSLDTSSVAKAIKQIDQYKREFQTKWNSLLDRLVEEGTEIAKVKVVQLDAVMFGDLLNSIEGVYDPATGIGLIVAGAPHAVFVEFGTGIVGAQNPHPEIIPGWRYDSNNHGEAGWWYLGDWDGNWHWTKGMPSRPFMWETARELPMLFDKLVREVFK